MADIIYDLFKGLGYMVTFSISRHILPYAHNVPCTQSIQGSPVQFDGQLIHLVDENQTVLGSTL